jgi:hypothetical protein
LRQSYARPISRAAAEPSVTQVHALKSASAGVGAVSISESAVASIEDFIAEEQK